MILERFLSGPSASAQNQLIYKLIRLYIAGDGRSRAAGFRYYLERRDPEFKQKMAEVLWVYREVKLIKETAAKQEPNDAVAIVSYDEKPGIQAIATTAPDLPPRSTTRPSRATTSTSATARSACWPASISSPATSTLSSGTATARANSSNSSKLLDAAYPTHTAIRLILDNHSADISKEIKAWLAERPTGRFEFTFTPKHGSWLNIVEGFFSKLARSVLRHIRVASKQELKERIMAAMDHFNRDPVVHTWSYKLDQAA